MFLIISILFLGGTFIWQIKSQAQVHALDNYRMDEKYIVEPTFSYNPGEEAYSAVVNVRNTGPIDIRLVQAWIIDEDNNDHKHIDISYYLPVDGSTYISEFDELTDSLSHPLNFYESTYYIKIVSERGNIAASRLMHGAEMHGDSNWPIIIDQDTSWIRKVHKKAHIHLEVWSQLDKNITISLIVVTKMDHGAEHSEIIYVDWTIKSRRITVGNFWGIIPEVYKRGELVFVELASEEGIVISSSYFTCQ